jgi:hypothetical protein
MSTQIGVPEEQTLFLDVSVVKASDGTEVFMCGPCRVREVGIY